MILYPCLSETAPRLDAVSSDESVVKVIDERGGAVTLRAVSPGSAAITITAYATDGSGASVTIGIRVDVIEGPP